MHPVAVVRVGSKDSNGMLKGVGQIGMLLAQPCAIGGQNPGEVLTVNGAEVISFFGQEPYASSLLEVRQAAPWLAWTFRPDSLDGSFRFAAGPWDRGAPSSLRSRRRP